MLKALPKIELLRAEALDQYEAVGGPPDPALAEITALAADICGTPMAAISIISTDDMHFLARVGPGPIRLPRGKVPCETCMRGVGVYEIPDARYDRAYRPDGFMISGRAYRFYAGAPLTTPANVNIRQTGFIISLPYQTPSGTPCLMLTSDPRRHKNSAVS